MSEKFMLILDDVKNKSLINDVVLTEVLHSNKELDKDASSKLFTTYSYRDDDKLPKELIEVGKKITILYVNYCLRLISLSSELINLSSLIKFDLKNCSNIISLLNQLTNLSSLLILNLEVD
uniref:NB-ARC domain-containing protein n=1 Tax=Physcomitrium patens TaxID=3218 RepID=A0A2K1J408_PHYPA|nr:hypothetical protein PHYPA_022109 [Physcomitrium patens]